MAGYDLRRPYKSHDIRFLEGWNKKMHLTDTEICSQYGTLWWRLSLSLVIDR